MVGGTLLSRRKQHRKMYDDRIKNVDIKRFRGGNSVEVEDVVLSERPLTIKVGDSPFVTVMCTPDDEFELAAGLLFSEGVIDSGKDIGIIRYCPEETEGVVEVRLTDERRPGAVSRIATIRAISRSSCGICDKELVDDILSFITPIQSDIVISAEKIIEIEAKLSAELHDLFKLTGAAHSAALLDVEGNVLSMAEDVGRHNALDKAIGKIILTRPSQNPSIAFLSSRASFEMVQKVARAQIPVACFASAVTDMAIDLAQRWNITLLGFTRPNGFNVYTQPHRILFS